MATCAALAGCSAQQGRVVAATQPSVATVALTTPQAVVPGALGAVGPLPTTGVPKVAAATPAGAKTGTSGVVGLASWYGDGFHGGKTANGERFDMGAISAAHRSFPLPSYVRVTNVNNGRSIVVRVNDRGPYHGNRVIDVSRRAADVLGFRGNGVGTVKLDYVGKAPGRSDDSRLLASYQEFGRPTLAPGQQMAALAPVSDAELAAEGASTGGAYAIASRAVTTSASYVVAAASTAKTAVVTTASTARAAVRKILPGSTEIAAATPAATAYAPPEPLLASAPTALTAANAAHGKRVVSPSGPALASAGPALRPSISSSEVASRIASSFDGFGPQSTTVTSGGSVSAEAIR